MLGVLTPPTREAFDEAVQKRADEFPPSPANHPDAHARLALLIEAFAEAMVTKLHRSQEKYGWPIEQSWMGPNWGEEECRQELSRHIEKGDPIDVANYCAFMWFHGWSTKGVLDGRMDELMQAGGQ